LFAILTLSFDNCTPTCSKILIKKFLCVFNVFLDSFVNVLHVKKIDKKVYDISCDLLVFLLNFCEFLLCFPMRFCQIDIDI
jgi:hypothetical protein